MNYLSELPYDPQKADAIEVISRGISYDNGRSWRAMITVNYTDDPYPGKRIENGPSMSGFWGDGSIRSGLIISSCRRWTGSRWIKI